MLKPKSLFVLVRDVGGANAVLPVARELRRRGVPLEVRRDGIAAGRRLGDDLEAVDIDAAQAAALDPSAYAGLLTSMCSEDGVWEAVVPRFRGVSPVLALQDYWGGRIMQSWADPRFRPDAILVIDAAAAELVRRHWPGFPEAAIHEVGMPAMDALRSGDILGARRALRAAWGVPEGRKLVAYFSDLLLAGVLLKEFVDAFQAARPDADMVLRAHPGLVASKYPQDLASWDEVRAAVSPAPIMGEGPGVASWQVAAACDVCVADYSTVLVEAYRMGIPVVAHLFPGTGAKLIREGTGGVLDRFPLEAPGRVFHADGPEAFVRCLQGALRADVRPHDPGAPADAARAADAVLRILA